MARPQKQTVDYFSHDADASTGKTISILENHFGVEGYAAWFKLLEQLARTRNHIINLRNGEDIEFLAVRLGLKPERLLEILNKMAELDAIDRELWTQHTIWSQNFVDRLKDVYDNRKQPLPNKPSITTISNPVSTIETLITTPVIPQRKLKETKGNQTIIIPDFVNKDLWEDFLEMRRKIRKPPTDKAKSLLLKDLEKYRAAGDDISEILRQSIKNNWAGVFPPKGGQGGAHKRYSGTKLPPRDGYTKPPPDPELDEFVRQDEELRRKSEGKEGGTEKILGAHES